MPGKFRERLKTSPVLCDGATGTLLYAKGIFINRCYDELNVSQPDMIRGLHHEYLQAGAEIIETNTFGANSFRLERHSLADKVREINVAGARLAKEAAKSFDAWVAGSVGPLGIRIDVDEANVRPLGQHGIRFREDVGRPAFEDIQTVVGGFEYAAPDFGVRTDQDRPLKPVLALWQFHKNVSAIGGGNFRFRG